MKAIHVAALVVPLLVTGHAAATTVPFPNAAIHFEASDDATCRVHEDRLEGSCTDVPPATVEALRSSYAAVRAAGGPKLVLGGAALVRPGAPPITLLVTQAPAVSSQMEQRAMEKQLLRGMLSSIGRTEREPVVTRIPSSGDTFGRILRVQLTLAVNGVHEDILVVSGERGGQTFIFAGASETAVRAEADRALASMEPGSGYFRPPFVSFETIGSGVGLAFTAIIVGAALLSDRRKRAAAAAARPAPQPR